MLSTMLSCHVLCGVAGVLICSITQVLAKENGGTLVCSTVWTLGEEISLTFYIDRSKYPRVCTGGYSRYPAFEKSADSETYFANCSVKYDITQPGSCSTSLGLGECGCTSKNASFYEIKYKFLAHNDYNGWWRPDLACIDERPEQLLSYTLSQGCTNVSVVTPGDEPPANISASSAKVETTIVTFFGPAIVLLASVVFRRLQP